MIKLRTLHRGKEAVTLKHKLLRVVFLSLVAVSTFFYACSKEKSDTPEPIKELIADLSAQNADCTCDPFINQYSWRGERVYVFSCKGPACNCITEFYDSRGQKFELPAGYSLDQFFRESSLVEHTWTCR